MAAPARPLALLLTAALTLAACGQSAKDSAKDFTGAQKAVAQTVEDLQKQGQKRSATGAKNICDDLLAPGLVARIKEASSKGCDVVIKDALSDADAFELQVQKVTINGDKATAVVKSQAGGSKDRIDTLQLQRVGNRWKIAALGGTTAAR
jgi:hypothetical protein